MEGTGLLSFYVLIIIEGALEMVQVLLLVFLGQNLCWLFCARSCPGLLVPDLGAGLPVPGLVLVFLLFSVCVA